MVGGDRGGRALGAGEEELVLTHAGAADAERHRIDRRLAAQVRRDVLSGGHAVAAAVQRTLNRAGLAREPDGEGVYRFLCTGDADSFHALGTRFLQTIVWTVLAYNPVRVLGGIGLGLAAITAVILAVVAGMRVAGITRLGPWGVVSVFVASLCAVAGVTLFSLGATFNYLVSLFNGCPMRQGLFGKPLFRRPLEHHFGWLGVLMIGLGVIGGAISLGFSLGGWPVERLWLYLLGAAMLVLVGLQMTSFWVIVQVLGELSQREMNVMRDLAGQSCEP